MMRNEFKPQNGIYKIIPCTFRSRYFKEILAISQYITSASLDKSVPNSVYWYSFRSMIRFYNSTGEHAVQQPLFNVVHEKRC